jgi:hypothetical protein
MPIPQPRAGEKEEEYIDRCMSVLETEYDDISQRYAVCIGKFEGASETSIIKHKYSAKNNGAKLAEAVQHINQKFSK